MPVCLLAKALNLFAVQQALLGDAIPTTGATKALLTAYQEAQKPSKPKTRWVSVVSFMSTASIILRVSSEQL